MAWTRVTMEIPSHKPAILVNFAYVFLILLGSLGNKASYLQKVNWPNISPNIGNLS